MLYGIFENILYSTVCRLFDVKSVRDTHRLHAIGSLDHRIIYHKQQHNDDDDDDDDDVILYTVLYCSRVDKTYSTSVDSNCCGQHG